MPAEGLFSLMWLLIALPLASAAILLSTGRRSNSWGPYLGVLSVCASAVLGVLLLIEMMGLPTEERAITQVAYQWVFVGNFTVDLAFQLDQLLHRVHSAHHNRGLPHSHLLIRLHVP